MNTEERILKHSMRLFSEKGYHGTSIDDITQASGLTKGALYWHFKSKEDLLKRIIEEYENSFLDKMIQVVNDVKGGSLDKFEKYLRFCSVFPYYNRELCASFDTLAVELIGAHHKIEPEIIRIYKKHRKFLSELIIQGKKERIFHEKLNARYAALAIVSFQNGGFLQWSMNRDEVNGEKFVKALNHIVLNGMKASSKIA